MSTAQDDVALRALCAWTILTITGCYGVQSPTDHAGYTRGEEIVLTGYALDPGRAIVGIVSPSSAGGGAPFSGARVFTGTTGSSPAGTFEGGRPYYGWTMRSVLPASAWRSEADTGCTVDAAYIMVGEARPGLGSTVTLATPYLGNTPSLSATQRDCLEMQLDRGASLNGARTACAVLPAAQRHIASNRLVGDVTIDSYDDLAALRCVDEIDGSLTVASEPSAPGSDFDVSLPRLKRVTGDVLLTYNMRYIPPILSIPTRCGGRSHLTSRRIDLPALTQVDGELRIDVPGSSASGGEYVELGLNALQKVGGDVDMQFAVPPEPCGLNALTSIPGRLRLAWRMDVTPQIGGFLSRLRSVGSLEIENGDTISRGSRLLASLENAGSIRLYSIGVWQDPLPGLRRVSGDLSIIESELRDAIAPLLTTIGGTLSVTGSRASPLSLGAATLTAAGVTVSDNPFACVLEPSSLTSPCPALSTLKLRLRSTGSLTVARNSRLPASQICAFRDLMVSRGFRGTSDLGGTSCP